MGVLGASWSHPCGRGRGMPVLHVTLGWQNEKSRQVLVETPWATTLAHIVTLVGFFSLRIGAFQDLGGCPWGI